MQLNQRAGARRSRLMAQIAVSEGRKLQGVNPTEKLRLRLLFAAGETAVSDIRAPDKV